MISDLSVTHTQCKTNVSTISVEERYKNVTNFASYHKSPENCLKPPAPNLGSSDLDLMLQY